MRLLHRLNQYQRLWQPSAGAPQQVTVGELAERCFCSERHVRTLLRQAQEAGWLSWQASSGRGKRGQLLFHKTPESLRNEMMEQALRRVKTAKERGSAGEEVVASAVKLLGDMEALGTHIGLDPKQANFPD